MAIDKFVHSVSALGRTGEDSVSHTSNTTQYNRNVLFTEPELRKVIDAWAPNCTPLPLPLTLAIIDQYLWLAMATSTGTDTLTKKRAC